eukprot:gene30531-35560_t
MTPAMLRLSQACTLTVVPVVDPTEPPLKQMTPQDMSYNSTEAPDTYSFEKLHDTSHKLVHHPETGTPPISWFTTHDTANKLEQAHDMALHKMRPSVSISDRDFSSPPLIFSSTPVGSKYSLSTPATGVM